MASAVGIKIKGLSTKNEKALQGVMVGDIIMFMRRSDDANDGSDEGDVSHVETECVNDEHYEHEFSNGEVHRNNREHENNENGGDWCDEVGHTSGGDNSGNTNEHNSDPNEDNERELQPMETDESEPDLIPDDGSDSELSEPCESKPDVTESDDSEDGSTDSNDSIDIIDHDCEPGAHECGQICPLDIYVVTKIEKTRDGATITDLELVDLEYHADPSENCHSYQIYGSEINYDVASSKCAHVFDDQSCKLSAKMTIVTSSMEFKTHRPKLNPHPDTIRHLNTPYLDTCPIRCDDGWLQSRRQIANYVDPIVYGTNVTLEHKPICPVCMGLPLLKWQQSLLKQLEIYSTVGFDDTFSFTVGLNERRRVLGYGFYQYDEREWNMFFNDTPANNGIAGLPTEIPGLNAGITKTPVSDEVLATLPRKPFADAKAKIPGMRIEGEQLPCHICKEDLMNDVRVMQLPCKHVYCEECAIRWLKEWNKCPACRTIVSS